MEFILLIIIWSLIGAILTCLSASSGGIDKLRSDNSNKKNIIFMIVSGPLVWLATFIIWIIVDVFYIDIDL